MRVPCSFMFYLIFLSYITSSCTLGFALNKTDRIALLAFKDAIVSDPNGVFNSWNNSIHHCQWEGITCSTKHPQRVTSIELISQWFVGSLSSHIGNLSFLRIIFLQDNNFHGEIPPEIGKLFRPRVLQLINNYFHGEVPKNLTSCTNLREINFIDNNLKGKLPDELTLKFIVNLVKWFEQFVWPGIEQNMEELSPLSLVEDLDNLCSL